MPRPNSRDPETAFLGEELARARLAAGFSSQQALADHLGFDRSVVGKAESGDRPPTPDVLRAWCQACRLDYDHFARLAGLARRADGPVESWFVEWLEKEAAAQMIRAWSPVLLPGLLQRVSTRGRCSSRRARMTITRMSRWRCGWAGRRSWTGRGRRMWWRCWMSRLCG